VINHVMKECSCEFCMRKMASQTAYVGDLRNNYSDKRIAILEDYGSEVKGEGLQKVAQDLYASGQLII
jgi:Anion-transporting ATPase